MATDLKIIMGNLMSQLYMDDVLRTVVLHFLCFEPVQVPSLGCKTRTRLARISIFFHQNNDMRMEWPVPSSDVSTIENVKDIFDRPSM